MGDCEEYGEPDRRRMDECRHWSFPGGIPLGGGDVRGRYGYSLVANQLETPLSLGVLGDAAVADRCGRMPRHRRHLPVRHGGYATIYIFSILKIVESGKLKV